MPPSASDILKYKTSENTYTALISIDIDAWPKLTALNLSEKI